jgi:alpha-tubulin suppressor-like RCC1 family protein
MPLGEPCPEAGACASGYCVDDVCCEEQCGGKCKACVTKKTGVTSGKCAPVSADTDPDDECDIEPGSCAGTGTCSGVAAMCGLGPAPAGTVCREPAGGCDLAEKCNGTATTCPSNALVPKGLPGLGCWPYLCNGNGACPTGCGVDGQCTGTHHCGTQLTCVPWRAVAAGHEHTCARLENGKVRCWGRGWNGQLGYGDEQNIGDDETPASAGDVDVGGVVNRIVTGFDYSCAVLDSGQVRCWGYNNQGQLGYGNTKTIGDDEHPASAGGVALGETAKGLAIGGHSCALLASGQVRCWGWGAEGQLGYGNTLSIGDDEKPLSESVDVGGTVVQLAVGESHTCALLTNGRVRCWGWGGDGRLGYGKKNSIGDDETPTSAGDVEVGMPAVQITAGASHTCALLAGGKVRCWGWGGNGQLGYGNKSSIGDDETPASAGDIDVGGAVVQIAAGGSHTCALLFGGKVRCWGTAEDGQLGYGNYEIIGDDETPASAGFVDVAGSVAVVQIATGGAHTCALLGSGKIRCWGAGLWGRLGYGNTNSIGNDETPASAGDVPVE